MSKTNASLILLIILCLPSLPGSAQVQPDSIARYRIETKDGNSYTGTIVQQDELELKFSTEKLGILTFSKKDIRSMTLLQPDKIKKGEYWPDNPQSTRYLWQPNGYGLKSGEAYYQNIWVLFNQVSVGITDYFSAGIGTIPLFLFSGTATPIWIAPKISIPVKKNKFNLGAGGLFAIVLGESSSGFGILYGVATAGSRDRNVSLGLGYGFAGGDWAKSPTFSLSSIIRTGPKGYFISENYFIDTGLGTNLLLLSAGYRWIINRVGLDVSLIMPYEESMESVFLFPWLGITIPFGNLQSYEK
jgi:hypothetical protein